MFSRAATVCAVLLVAASFISTDAQYYGYGTGYGGYGGYGGYQNAYYPSYGYSGISSYYPSYYGGGYSGYGYPGYVGKRSVRSADARAAAAKFNF
uniref:Uncharacterized protein n=1 Tax=Plectus sambesii TaxID=2011161 RepID=A0A914UMY7_9BILA